MITICFKYNCSDVEYINNKINNYSACVRFLYKKSEELCDDMLLLYCKRRFGLSDIELRSLIVEVKQIKNVFLSKIESAKDTIKDIQEKIEELSAKLKKVKLKPNNESNSKKIKFIKRKIFRLNRKISQNQRFVSSEIVFGGRSLLRKISYLNNDKTSNEADIIKYKNEYQHRRCGGLFLMGEANQKGNRFFDFDLPNKQIIYKPQKNKKITFDLSKRSGVDYNKLQYLIDNKLISITVRIDNNTLSIMFDESILSGFYIDKSERRKEVIEKTKHITDKEVRKSVVNQIYVKYYRELEEKQLKGKLPNRYLGIDLNPDYIGYSIIDKNKSNYRIIDSGCFDLKKLNVKPKKSSDSDYSLYLNNKRKHEIKEVINHIFKIMKHHKVAFFVMEDLEFKDNKQKEFSKEFNRKTKNIWNRELIENLINKKCTEGGYQLIKVNPVYSSLIGNLTNKIFDPVAASIEITRRGAFKYDKGHFYPKNNLSTTHTTELVAKKLHIDVELIKDKTWKEITPS